MKKYPRIGRYIIQNKEKYVANLQECQYRSSWELKYMKYLDTHPNIIEWGSENVIIPYYSPAEKKRLATQMERRTKGRLSFWKRTYRRRETSSGQ